MSLPDWTAIKGQNTDLEPCFQFLQYGFLCSDLGGYRRVRDGIQYHVSQILERRSLFRKQEPPSCTIYNPNMMNHSASSLRFNSQKRKQTRSRGQWQTIACFFIFLGSNKLGGMSPASFTGPNTLGRYPSHAIESNTGDLSQDIHRNSPNSLKARARRGQWQTGSLCLLAWKGQWQCDLLESQRWKRSSCLRVKQEAWLPLLSARPDSPECGLWQMQGDSKGNIYLYMVG